MSLEKKTFDRFLQKYSFIYVLYIIVKKYTLFSGQNFRPSHQRLSAVFRRDGAQLTRPQFRQQGRQGEGLCAAMQPQTRSQGHGVHREHGQLTDQGVVDQPGLPDARVEPEPGGAQCHGRVPRLQRRHADHRQLAHENGHRDQHGRCYDRRVQP